MRIIQSFWKPCLQDRIPKLLDLGSVLYDLRPSGDREIDVVVRIRISRAGAAVFFELRDFMGVIAGKKPKVAVELELLGRHRPAAQMAAVDRRQHAEVDAMGEF